MGLQRHLDYAASFCDLRHLIVKLGKSKVKVFNGIKTSHLDHYIVGTGIEIVRSFKVTPIWRLIFFGPHFNLRPAI